MNLEITAFAAVSEAPRRARRTRRVLPMTDDSDEALMLAYARGNAASFDALYLRHKGGLFRYLLRHTRNRALADDLFQEVWGKLIDTRARYEVRAKFQTFLYTIAHHCFIDHCRRSAVRPTHSPSSMTMANPTGAHRMKSVRIIVRSRMKCACGCALRSPRCQTISAMPFCSMRKADCRSTTSRPSPVWDARP
jgi:RNA polymerase sigma factor (sigma-70 family)